MSRMTEEKKKRRLARKSRVVPNYMPKLTKGLELPQTWGETVGLFKTRQYFYLKDTIVQAAKPLKLTKQNRVPEHSEGTYTNDEGVSGHATDQGKEQEDAKQEYQEADGRGLSSETSNSY